MGVDVTEQHASRMRTMGILVWSLTSLDVGVCGVGIGVGRYWCGWVVGCAVDPRLTHRRQAEQQ